MFEKKKTLYILVRIPKSGSQSLRTIVRESLPQSTYFRIPCLDLHERVDQSLAANFRRKRRLIKGILFSYGVLNEKALWEKINNNAQDGDIISGHFSYGRPHVPSSETRYITLLRDPIERMISAYNYTREGYPKHSHLRRFYLEQRTKIAGTGSFSDYLEYLHLHKERYSNPATGLITGSRSHPDAFSFLKENYFHFGILERMDLFSDRLSEKLNTPSCEAWTNKTKTKTEILLSEHDSEILDALLGKDIELYNKVKAFITENK